MVDAKLEPVDSGEDETPEAIYKRDFLREVGKEVGLSYRETESVYDAILTVLFRHIREGREVQLVGFGKFYPQVRRGGSLVGTGQVGKRGFQKNRSGERTLPMKHIRFSGSTRSRDYLQMDDEEAENARIPGTRTSDED